MTNPMSRIFGKSGLKNVLLLLLLVVGLLIVVVQVGRKQLFQKKAAGGNATVILVPNSNTPVTVTNNGTFNVVVSLNPNGEALVGADVLLDFNKTALQVTAVQIPNPIPASSNFKTYAPVNADGSFNATQVINNANSTGVVEMSGVAFTYNPAPGQVMPAQTGVISPFATITFKALQVGSSNIKVRFTSGSTIDTNLVSIASGTPTDVISDSTATALDTTVPVTVTSGITPTIPTSPTAAASPTPAAGASPTPTTGITPTPTTGVTTATLNFSIKFQGVNTTGPNKNVSVILRQGTDTTNSVAVTSNSSGVYTGVLTNITPGNYDILIKGPVHLRKKMTASPIAINSGSNTQNWSSTVLAAGDINNDNKVDSSDYALLLLKYNPGSTQAVNEDLNLDSKVDSSDYALLVINYNPTLSGD